MKKNIVFIILFAALFSGCKEAYNPPIYSPVTGYLVVEGFINSNGGSSTFTLTRTTKLQDSVSIAYEHRAVVQIESDNNESYPLYEGINGVYTSAPIALNPSSKYRVRINTTDGKEYLSDFSSYRTTPPLDSLSWQRENGGVNIYVNTHDDLNSVGYYRWNYSETWEFHSAYLSFLQYSYEPVLSVEGRTNTDSLYRCWKTQNPSYINLGTTEKLSTNRIYLPIRYIEQNAEELSVLYYIKVTQTSLSHEAYLFYQKLKKNTERLGSIFDAQPSELAGNIHCTTNNAEIVIGYVEVSSQTTDSIFISNQQVTPWGQIPACSTIEIYNQPDSIEPFKRDYIPIAATLLRGLTIVKFSAAPPECVDCRLRGSDVKPSFWP